MRRYNLKEFELSQSYLFFWDKLEKANFFLEQVLDTTDEELDGRLVQSLMASPVGDGGQWDMVANLVEKYGLVGAYWFYSELLYADARLTGPPISLPRLPQRYELQHNGLTHHH